MYEKFQVIPWASQRRVAVCPSITIISGSGTMALGTVGNCGPPSTNTSTLVSVVPLLLRATHTYIPLSSGRATRICTKKNQQQSSQIFKPDFTTYRTINYSSCDFDTCMRALVSIGTGLPSMVLRLSSSLCHETETRDSPDPWHSKLMGSPTLTRTGPVGVTVTTGESEGPDTKHRNGSQSVD